MDDPRLDEFIDKIDFLFIDKTYEGLINFEGNIACNQLDCTAFIIKKGTSLRNDIIKITIDDSRVEIDSQLKINYNDLDSLNFSEIKGGFLISKFNYNIVQTNDIITYELAKRYGKIDEYTLNPEKFTEGFIHENLIDISFNLENIIDGKIITMDFLKNHIDGNIFNEYGVKEVLLIDNINFKDKLSYDNVRIGKITKENINSDKKLDISNILGDISDNIYFYNDYYDIYIDTDISNNIPLFTLDEIFSNTNELLDNTIELLNNNNLTIQIKNKISNFYTISYDFIGNISNTNDWEVYISDTLNGTYNKINFNTVLSPFNFIKIKQISTNSQVIIKNIYERLHNGPDKVIVNSQQFLGNMANIDNNLNVNNKDISYIDSSGNINGITFDDEKWVIYKSKNNINFDVIKFNYETLDFDDYIKLYNTDNNSYITFYNTDKIINTLPNNYFEISGQLSNMLETPYDPYNLVRSRDPILSIQTLSGNIGEYFKNNSTTLYKSWIYFWNDVNEYNKFYPYEIADLSSVINKFAYNYSYKLLNNPLDNIEPPGIPEDNFPEYSELTNTFVWRGIKPIKGILYGVPPNDSIKFYYESDLGNYLVYNDDISFLSVPNSDVFYGLTDTLKFNGNANISGIDDNGNKYYDAYIPNKYIYDLYYSSPQLEPPQTSIYSDFINKQIIWKDNWPKVYDLSYDNENINGTYNNSTYNTFVTENYKNKYNNVEIFFWREMFPVNVPNYPNFSTDGNPINNNTNFNLWKVWGNDESSAFTAIHQLNDKYIYIDTSKNKILINDNVLDYIDVSGDLSFNRKIYNWDITPYTDNNFNVIETGDWDINTHIIIEKDNKFVKFKNMIEGREYWERNFRAPDSNHILNEIMKNDIRRVTLWNNIFNETSDRRLKTIIYEENLYKNYYYKFLQFNPISYNLIYDNDIQYGFNANELEKISKEYISTKALYHINLNKIFNIENDTICLDNIEKINDISDIIITIKVILDNDIVELRVNHIGNYYYKLSSYDYKFNNKIHNNVLNIISIGLKNLKGVNIKNIFYTGLISLKYIKNDSLCHEKNIKNMNNNTIKKIINTNYNILDKIKNKLS